MRTQQRLDNIDLAYVPQNQAPLNIEIAPNGMRSVHESYVADANDNVEAPQQMP